MRSGRLNSKVDLPLQDIVRHALKFWGDDRVANFVTYTKVFILGFLVYNDEGFMQKFGYQNPEAPHTAQLTRRYVARSISRLVQSLAAKRSSILPQRTCENIRPTPRRFFVKYPTLAFSNHHLAEKKFYCENQASNH